MQIPLLPFQMYSLWLSRLTCSNGQSKYFFLIKHDTKAVVIFVFDIFIDILIIFCQKLQDATQLRKGAVIFAMLATKCTLFLKLPANTKDCRRNAVGYLAI